MLLLGFSLAAAAFAACNDAAIECAASSDCGGSLVCADGACVACVENSDCGADAFCCQGECLPASGVEQHCGCSPSVEGSSGMDCSVVEPTAFCLVDDAPATIDTVALGACGCGCSPAEGGPFCVAPEPGDASMDAQCMCTENADCLRPSADRDGRPHLATDTCTPADRCVCYSSGAPCDPDGAMPDCTSSGGCADLVSDPENCGVAGRSCTDPATGAGDGGACIDGGCTCNDAADCTGTGINVDTCAFLTQGEPARCVCAGYTRDGLQAPCPMEAACVEGGCLFDGEVYGTEGGLRAGVGIR